MESLPGFHSEAEQLILLTPSPRYDILSTEHYNIYINIIADRIAMRPA